MSDTDIRFGEVMDFLGSIDVYLLDQVMKGRLAPPMSILDAGCGGGRNLAFLLRAGFDACGADIDPGAIESVRRMAEKLAPDMPSDRFVAAPVEAMPFPDGNFQAVVSNAVLHFARDEAHFDAMLGEMWRVLAPGGIFFARLASTIGIEDRVRPIQGRRFRVPDGSERFLVDEVMLADRAAGLGGRAVEPLKTVNVQGLRCMSTWVLQKD